MNSKVIFDFDRNADIRNWRIVDDVVMGGRSSGSFELSPEGHGVFSGTISLENFGGFSSVRYRAPKIEVTDNTTIRIRVKGDGKRYQLRIKHDASSYYSYISYFETAGNWEDIELPLKDMVPSFRGRRLDQPNFAHETIEEISFLIGNKKSEGFKLLLDKIELK
jgi:hypothetical protein